MPHDVYVNDVLRERWAHETTPRTVTFWDASGAQVSQREYLPGENAEADREAAAARRETNRLTLRDRAEAALAGNLTALPTAQSIEGQTSWNNSQRDAALRFLGGQAVDRIKQSNAIIKLLLRDERPDLLDTAE